MKSRSEEIDYSTMSARELDACQRSTSKLLYMLISSVKQQLGEEGLGLIRRGSYEWLLLRYWVEGLSNYSAEWIKIINAMEGELEGDILDEAEFENGAGREQNKCRI